MHLAIDPGVTAGWALFTSAGELSACGLGDPPSEYDANNVLRHGVLIEHPWHRPGSAASQPNDEIALGVNAGEHGGRFRAAGVPVMYVKPHEWKGSVPKSIHHDRVWSKLTTTERAIADAGVPGMYGYMVKVSDFLSGRRATEPKSKHHNAMDAIGLGLFKVGR